jgi:hypothetical protein
LRLARKFLVGLACVLLLACFGAVALSAPPSQAIEWSAPIELSQSQWSDKDPLIAADSAGNVHVLWGELTGHVDYHGRADTIFYTRWDGESWLTPLDVLSDGEGGPLSAAVDGAGRLHLIWMGTSGFQRRLYHSWTWVQQPVSARSWTTTELDVSNGFSYADLVIDSTDTLHLVYDLENQAIYYTQSSDAGQHWSAASTVMSANPGSPVGEPQIRVDSKGTRHVVWTEHNDAGNNIAVFYASSADGQNWTSPKLIADGGCGWISVGIDGDDNVHLVWSRGVGSEDGRYHSWSTDGGSTWSPPKVMRKKEVSGYTGWSPMAVDSAGTLHLVMSAKADLPAGRRTAILHFQWNEETESWSEPTEISYKPDTAGEYPRIAITGGNVLHVVWFQWSEPARVFYARGLLPAPAITLRPLPTSSPAATVTPELRISPSPPPVPTSTVQRATLSPVDARVMGEGPPPWLPVGAGLAPVFLLLSVVLLVRLRPGR